MRRAVLLSTSAFAGLLALGCAEQQSPTAPTGGSPPAFTTPSLARGALVERGTLDVGFTIVDEESGLTTVIGNSFAELAVLCAGGQAPSGFPVLFVTRPTGAAKLLLKGAEAEVVVWQLVSGDFCGVLATTQPYAEGTVRLRLTDNEATDFPVEPGGNASVLHAVGTVTVLATGEELHYQAVNHLFAPRGATSFDDVRIVRSYIRLR